MFIFQFLFTIAFDRAIHFCIEKRTCKKSGFTNNISHSVIYLYVRNDIEIFFTVMHNLLFILNTKHFFTSPLTQQNSKKLNFSSPPQPNSSSTYDFLQVPGRLPVARYKRWKSKCNLKLISKHRTRLLVILITNYWFWVINLALIWSKPVVHHQFLLLEIMFTSMFTFTFRQPGRRGQ